MFKVPGLTIFILLAIVATARAENAKKAAIENYAGDIMEPSFSLDGSILFFNNNKTGLPEKDIFWARRIDDHHFQFMGEVADVNSAYVDGTPVADLTGNFYFISNRAYSKHAPDTIYKGRFSSTTGKVSGVDLLRGLGGEFGFVDMDVGISGDGNALYISRGDFTRGAPPRSSRLIRAVKKKGAWHIDPKSDFYFKNINKDKMVYAAEVSRDELVIYYTKADFKKNTFLIMRAARKTKVEPFANPTAIYTRTGLIEGPAISHDGKLLYFHAQDRGSKDIGLYSIPLR